MNHLLDLHRQAEAEFQPYGEIDIVSTFGEPPAEYAAIRKGCGLIDLPQRGVIELTGKDRLSFLNNLISNETFFKETKRALEAGRGVYAFLLNAKTGRIITDLNVIERGDRTLLELDVRRIDTVSQTLNRYLFAEQVTINDRRDELHEVALLGPASTEVLQLAGADGINELKVTESVSANLFGIDVVIWRDDPTGTPGLHLVVAKDSARTLWMEFLSRFGSTDQSARRKVRPVGWAAFNATRIEAGRALFGIDFDDSTLPHETGALLSRAVSFTKGCYPGQEIVARMQARQQVARKIAGFRVDSGELPIAGAKLYDDKGNEVGGVTSSTVAPVLSNAVIGMALLKRPHFNAGASLRVPADGEMRVATIVDLPFLK